MRKLTTFYDLEDFLKTEDETAKKTLSHFKKEFEWYKRSFNLLSKTVAYLLDLTKDKPTDSQELAIFSIITRIIQSMQSIRNLTLKGYYYDVSVLERSLIESIGLCAYLALNEKEAENWIDGKDVKIAKIRLFGYVLKLLRIKGTDAEPYRVYGELCEYVHTKARAIVSFMDFNRIFGEVGLQFTPEFFEKKVHAIACYPTLMLAVVKEIFKHELTEKRKSEIMRFLRQYSTETKSTS